MHLLLIHLEVKNWEIATVSRDEIMLSPILVHIRVAKVVEFKFFYLKTMKTSNNG